ncbi:RNase adapter RapZ, partial [uncultured Muribaculum sp.]
FQGGRRGPYHYDIVSFLWQAKANFPDWLRERLLDVYIESASRYIAIDRRRFDEELRYVRLLRILQVLGAYGFRGRIERKPHFLQSIPKALENLRELLTEPLDEYAYLNSVLNELVKEEASDEACDGLTVKVASFGFRKHGIPEDNSGNGGGFVFDCRAIHNPGRYDDYKSLTGLDREVIEFLEREDDMHRFLEHAFALVDASVERYIKRGFQHLMVSFGCTGGQHRSVYSAERMVRHLHEKYNVRVVVDHVEQNMHKVINPKQINR